MSKVKTYKPIPVSSATTAWGLLQAVKRAILEEPRRVNMNLYVSCINPSSSAPRGVPACGTVGCFAGWVAVLGRQHLASRYEDTRDRQVIDNFTDADAQKLLGPGINYNIAGDEGRYVFNSGEGDACSETTPGTKAHARAVVARINKFMRVNEVALKARKLSQTVA